MAQTQATTENQFSTETIGSLMAECEELTQQISDEKDRLERFMLETGGASDASDRIQANIDSMKELLTAAENRLQTLFDAQEQEAFALERPATDRPGAATERPSVKKNLAEKKAEVAIRNLPEKEKGKKSPGMDMEK